MKLDAYLDEQIEALTYHSVHRKKWKIINELLAEALKGRRILPIPEEAKEDYPLHLPQDTAEKKHPASHPKKAKQKD